MNPPLRFYFAPVRDPDAFRGDGVEVMDFESREEADQVFALITTPAASETRQ